MGEAVTRAGETSPAETPSGVGGSDGDTGTVESGEREEPGQTSGRNTRGRAYGDSRERRRPLTPHPSKLSAVRRRATFARAVQLQNDGNPEKGRPPGRPRTCAPPFDAAIAKLS